MKKKLFIKPRMIGYVAASIDGRISLHKTTMPSWTSKEDWDFFQNELSVSDAVVVGRNTYQSVSARLRKRMTYVLTRRIKRMYRRGTVTFVNPHRTRIENILSKYKRIAVVGGASIYDFMLDRKFMDELYVTFEPCLFGRGRQMFESKDTARLKLLSIRKLNDSGTLLLHYKILHSHDHKTCTNTSL